MNRSHSQASRTTAADTHSGFTLVELLVVIGIIALLISILLPALNRAREEGNRVKCLSNIRQIGNAFVMYTQENQLYFPAPAMEGAGARAEDWLWFQEIPCTGRPVADVSQSPIARYLGNFNPELFRCPSDDVNAHPDYGRGSGAYHYSYVMNYSMDGVQKKIKVTMVRSPSDKILIAEEDETSINDGFWNPGWITAAIDLLAIRHDSAKDPNDPRGQDLTVPTNKNALKRGNVGFVDGHAEYVPRTFAHDISHTDPARAN